MNPDEYKTLLDYLFTIKQISIYELYSYIIKTFKKSSRTSLERINRLLYTPFVRYYNNKIIVEP